MVGVEVRTMATPENQSLAGEKMAIRILMCWLSAIHRVINRY